MQPLRIFKYALAIAILSSAFTLAGRSVSGKWAVLSGPIAGSSLDSDSQPKNTSKPQQSSQEPNNKSSDSNTNAKVSQVADIQMLLARCGFLPEIEIDGLVGMTTLNATKAFQSSRGLVPDGIFGEKTIKSATNCKATALPGNS